MHTLHDTQDSWESLYGRINTKLFDYIRVDACQEVTRHFQNYFDNHAINSYVPALRHGDFGTGNIIYDPVSQSVVGAINFGNTGLDDPAVDFAGLFSSYGEDFYKLCAAKYPEMGSAWKRAHFYYGTFALQEALFGIENNDKHAFLNGIADFI